MAASVAVLRATREREAARDVREKADKNAEQLHRIAADIRRMTRIYQERLEGRRVDVER